MVMLSNADLEAKVPWQIAYAAVEIAVRKELDAAPAGATYSTSMLVEQVYNGGDAKCRARVFKALTALEDHGLAHYVTRGAWEKIGAVTGQRRIWCRPDPGVGPADPHRCPTCKRPL